MKELVGKQIDSISVNHDQSVLRVVCSGEPLYFVADGDCCSESWFADINGADNLIGGVVTSVERLSMDSYNVEDGRGRQQSDKAYGYRIVSNNGSSSGYCDIVFRNSSNGYYGGNLWVFNPLEWDKPFSGFDGYKKRIVDSSAWIDIREDWSA